MSRKTKILIVGLFVGCFLIASQASAQGLIPCGQREDNPDPDVNNNIDESAPCTLCHFFILIENILEFVFFKLAPPLALLMLIIGGGMFMLATGDPQKITTARKIISSVLIGIAIIYGSFFLVGLFLEHIGLAQWTTDIYFKWWDKGIFDIDCPVPTTTMAPPATVPPTTTAFTPPIAPGVTLTTLPIGTTFSSAATVITFPTTP